jgi:GntR family transcriptional regulator
VTVVPTSQDPDGPRYLQLARKLREQIKAGLIPAGSALPSETRLAKEFHVSVGTVRAAVKVLRDEALVVTEHGRATFVRAQLPVRRLGPERYRVEVDQVHAASTPHTSFTRDQGVDWSAYQLDTDFAEVPAPADVAEQLGVEAGTMLLRRHLVFRTHGYPQQMSTSYLLLDMVIGTPVADPANEPWPGGTIAQMKSVGVTVTAVAEAVRTRMPTLEEAATLRVPAGVPVLTITRRMLAGARPVEAAVDLVIPGDRVVLEYRIDLA